MLRVHPFVSGPGDDVVKTSMGTYTKHTHHDNLIFPEAQALCRISGAEILALETKLEYTALQPHLIRPNRMPYWLNGNDRRQKGIFPDNRVKSIRYCCALNTCATFDIQQKLSVYVKVDLCF